ncbi:MAG: pilus assembly protein, partial [Gammaproteobacteria bacterium]
SGTGAEDITLFVTSNDGYLHAVDTDDGAELFSFVPKEMLARLKTLRADPPLNASGREYGLDGPMTVWIKENAAAADPDRDIEPGEGDHVYLYFGERRGGRNYYAVDVTNRDAPELLWKIEAGVGDFKELGETWSAPKHTKVKIGTSEKDVLIFGGGYDPIQESATVPVDDGQGRAIYMVDAETGGRLWWTGNDALLPAPDLGFVEMTNSIPANVRVIDVDRDGLADRMYAADLRGQLWRFDINNGASGSGLVSGALMAQLQKTSASATPNTEADNRRFFSEPDAALIVPPGKPSFMSVSIGSGSRAHPLNLVTQDRFYVVRDPNPLRKPVAYPSALTEADLYDVTDVIKFTSEQQLDLDNAHGWRINLVDITTNEFFGEKVLNEAVNFGGVVLFGTFTPVATQSASACAPATGTGRIYALNILNGNPVYNLDQVGDDKDLKRTDRATDLVHSGIPPDIIIFFPEPEGGLEGEPTPVVGSEILNKLKFKNPVVKTYWYADEEGMY